MLEGRDYFYTGLVFEILLACALVMSLLHLSYLSSLARLHP